jgi:hypothetical protein
VKVWDPFIIFLEGVLITLLLIGAGLFIFRAHQRKDFNEKLLLYGFAILFYGAVYSRFFSILAVLQVSGVYINHTFYADTNNINPDYYTYIAIGFIGNMIAWALFVFIFEFNFKRTKYLLTIYNTISIVVLFLLPPFSFWSISIGTIFYHINNTAIPIILIIYSKWSHPEFRPASLVLFIGFILSGIGDIFPRIPQVPMILIQLIYIAALMIIISPTFISPEFFSRNLKYVIIIGVSSTYLLALTHLFLAIYFNLGVDAIIGQLLVLLFYCFYYYFIIKYIKSGKIYERQESLPDVLGIFSRPQRLTEEEVYVAKEKKICLVCKNKVGGFDIFLCKRCDSLYCENCARTLSNLENACWVCEAPFDESKPVKLPEKEEEEITIEGKDSKKVAKKGVPKKVRGDKK